MNHRAVAVAAAALALVLEARAFAGSPGDYLGAREVAMGDSLRADARGALALSLNPAGLGLTRELVFEGAFGYRFEDRARATTVAGCDSTVAVPGCFYYRYFADTAALGDDAAKRRAHEGGVALGRALSDFVLVGVGARYFDYEASEAGGEDVSGFTFDVGAIVRPGDMVALALVGHHLAGASAPQYSRSLGAGVIVRPLGGLTLSVDALWNLQAAEGDSTGRYGGGVEYFFRSSDMQTGYPVRAGAVHDVATGGTYLSAGVGLASVKVGLDVGARRQIRGGDDTMIVASLRIFGPRQVPGMGVYR